VAQELWQALVAGLGVRKLLSALVNPLPPILDLLYVNSIYILSKFGTFLVMNALKKDISEPCIYLCIYMYVYNVLLENKKLILTYLDEPSHMV